MRQSARLLLVVSLALGSTACASRHAPPPLPPAPIPKLAAVPPPPPAVPPGHLARLDVDRILTTQGPPWLLRQVISEEVLAKNGKFSGWRMVGLPEDWRGIDLKPGDIVTRVNGFPLERPDEFWTAWTSLALAPQVKIDLVRDGAARQVILPIDGAPSPDTARALGRDPGPPRAGSDAQQAQPSIRIGGGAVEPTDEDAY
jgi:hypothetical protein